MSRSRDITLAILRGERTERPAVFSGLPSLTEAGLYTQGIRYSQAHTDPGKMAAAAASTFGLYGFESAVVPFDLCVEAEALGCHIDFQTDLDIFMPPVVDVPLSWERDRIVFTDDRSQAGRIPIVAEAIRQLKKGVGREVAIGAWVPGPFTLAWQLFGAEAWLAGTKDQNQAGEVLDQAVRLLALVAETYARAGADFVTVHEMGGSPQVIGAEVFRTLVKPALAKLFARLPSPNVLSVCGDTNSIVRDLAECGADALSLDQLNDIARTRQILPGAVLLGNLDPVETLSRGTPEVVAQAVRQAMSAGVNAIWPGCDLAPEIPDANMRMLTSAGKIDPTLT